VIVYNKLRKQDRHSNMKIHDYNRKKLFKELKCLPIMIKFAILFLPDEAA